MQVHTAADIMQLSRLWLYRCPFLLVPLFVCWASCGVRGQTALNQTTLDALAASLKVGWTVVTNTREVYSLEARLSLENTGPVALDYGDWRLYWYSVYPVEPDHLVSPGTSMEVAGQGVKVTVVNGMLLYLSPTPTFTPLLTGDRRVLRLKVKYWSVARSDMFPNWYLAGTPGTTPTTVPRVISSTEGAEPTFISRATHRQQQKRYDFDHYADRSPRERYERNYVPYEAAAAPDSGDVGGEGGGRRVVPKPWRVVFQQGVIRMTSSWKVWDGSIGRVLANEAEFLVEKLTHLGVKSNAPSPPKSNVIYLNTGNIVIADDDVMDNLDDVYSLQVDDVTQTVNVTGRGPSGVFLALQTLLSLLEDDGTLPVVRVYDAPRFRFRGLFLDIARNFRSREEIERYLAVMAAYKLNKLHLHLSDDEGWRVEISGLPELTELGSKRCHDPEESRCLLPQLGSGPNDTSPGSGFLTTADYRAILQAARKLHIQVIPEVDVPGHSRAAIKAMELRYRNYMAQNNVLEAERYRLIEENDTSRYLTAQFFNDNTINVCRPSAYAFITKIVQELKTLHNGIQNLREFHVGLDEVEGAWVNSSLCQQLMETDSTANRSLKLYFFQRVADITSREGLELGGWEDGLMLTGNQPFDRSAANNSEVYANVWNNVWEWGTAARAHTLANMDYKVVMSQGTSLYFDHPYEPHWEERGYYWATRFTDTQKVFGFLPMNYYANILERTSGQPLNRKEVCGEQDFDCPPLEKPHNIVGMQGNLWGETVRTRDQADSQLFPRVLALAERAWHYATWEKETNSTRRHQLRTKDWYSFAPAVGYRELPRLDRLGIKYRIPPPGAVVEKQRLLVTAGYPGLQVEYTEGWGDEWKPVDGTQTLKENDRVWLRTRSADGKRYSRIVEVSGRPELPSTPQSVLDYMSEHLEVRFEITDNYLQYGTSRFVATLYLNNTGPHAIPAGNWELQFPCVQWLEPERLRQGREFVLQEHRLALSHVQGYLFRLSPLYDFPPFQAGSSKAVVFRGEYWSVSKYEQFPNYFVAAEGANARVINNTAGESMSFVNNFTKVNQWKRDATDRFDPLTPSARFGKQVDVSDLGFAPHPYLPTPMSFRMDRSRSITLKNGGWTVVAPDEWDDLAEFLKSQLNQTISTSSDPDGGSANLQVRLVRTVAAAAGGGVPSSPWPGAYAINVSVDNQSVTIAANDSTGALYGIQSLLNMLMQSGGEENGATAATTLFELTASDSPRFPVRSVFLDVSRNFHSQRSVLRLLRVMGMYKLNRLHLHLADDEGWRLQIPGLPELTEVGSTRCHDPTEERCLTPVLGSGPDPDNSGTGFYTKEEYQEILRYAAQRHIEIVPEFDMPGHSRAAIKAMALRRRRRLEAGDTRGAREYELDEAGDPSQYSSVQMYDDNAVNPCLNSTYAFLRHVMLEMRKMHAGVNPLRVYHFGGDEVALGAWVHSNACRQQVESGADLKFLFSTRVAAIAQEVGLDVGCWEDGVMDHGDPIPRQDMAPDQVFVNAWQNVWEWGAASRAYYLANEGYQVIMGQATFTYFDFPSEPDPEERGFYWATRYTDSRKVFGFQPQDLWSNVDITRMGDPITLQEVCGDESKGCPQLTKKENVVGMQGHLWSETVRTEEQVEYMMFPRLLALAERAWHRAAWEGQQDRDMAQLRDWTQFANSLGYSQLHVLDRLNVTYRLCPPGVSQEGGHLKVNTEFPGLKTQYMTSESGDWRDVSDHQISVKKGQDVHVRTESPDSQRFSKAVTVMGSGNDVTKSMATSPSSVTWLPFGVLSLLYYAMLQYV